MSRKKKPIRTDFRKNRAPRTRRNEFTRQYEPTEPTAADDLPRDERISGKGELTRRRTVLADEAADAGAAGFEMVLAVDEKSCLRGRVVSVYGLTSTVETDDGRRFECATRRILKTLSTGQRHVVASGDVVLFRTEGAAAGIIERVEPRHGVLSRASRGRQHIIVTNVDQLIIVSSAAEPRLKPNLIDRFLVSAEQNRIEPVICLNKTDLIDPIDLQPLIGAYSRMGYTVILASARTGVGIEPLRRRLAGRQTVFSGQSGVGKSSLLNAIEPGLALRVSAVSRETEKGRHTTTTAQVIRLQQGGWVVDTPGLRQFQLWDVVPEEVGNWYRDLRPLVGLCRFPDCSHTHEADCAVKNGVADGWLDARRYESYCQIREGNLE
ncbi:MAG: ribosome small subunit-dependent GTPase A [Planctomycetes bacterium]|nr:ribosome small subunit-dependent GTPase A [Planctomycetota bacterium]